MNVLNRVSTALGSASRAWKIAATGEQPVTMSEADANNLANDMLGFTQIGGSRVDLKEWDQTRMQKVALHLFRHNHMAKRLLEIIVDFVTGDGISVVAKHKDNATKDAIQAVLDEFWNDPINDMERLNPQRLLELNLWGEVLIPALTNEMTGNVRLGWIDPSNIVEIEPDPVTKRPARVKLTTEAAAEVGSDWLDVIRYSHAEGRMVGNAFFHQINHVLSARRGISEYFTAADWYDVLDETMKVSADRSKVLMSFIWDWTMQGMSDKECQAFAKSLRQPKPGMNRVHNEKVSIDAKAPQLAAYETSRLTKDLKTHIMGGHGYPNHWFGSGDDANLATAEQMSEATRKALKRKTKQFTFLLRDMCRFAIAQACMNPELHPGIGGLDPMSDCFDVVVPDVGGPDAAKIGAALVAMTQAISQALADGLIAEDTARSMFAAVASMTGVEIDPAAEGEKVEQASAEREVKEQAEQARMSDQIAAHAATLGRGPGAKAPANDED